MSKHILFFLEGATEVEFYKRVQRRMRDKTGLGRFPKGVFVTTFNLEGIGNYFNKKIISRIKDYKKQHFEEGDTIIVFLCYDLDVFSDKQFQNKKTINNVVDNIKKLKVDEVYPIKADRSIEDWFLIDKDGWVKYLSDNSKNLLKKLENKDLNGIRIIEDVLKKYKHETYVKGNRVEAFLDFLDVELIMCSKCSTIKIICDHVGVACEKCQCR